MSQQNQSRNRIMSQSKQALERKRLTTIEAKYLDWNSNIKDRLTNLTEQYDLNTTAGPGGQGQGQEGPGMMDQIMTEIKSVFALQPPQKVYPNSNQEKFRFNYFRPATVATSTGSSNTNTPPSSKPKGPKITPLDSSVSFLMKPKPPSKGSAYQYPTRPNNIAALKVIDQNPNVLSKEDSSKPELLETPKSLTSCLKNKSKRLKTATPRKAPVSATASKVPNVSFAPDTVVYQRENKPTKGRTPKQNRKPRFAHPCCGHFLPPSEEVMQWVGPSGLLDKNNLYTGFTAVWVHPSDRTSKETELKWMVRQKRFYSLLTDLSDVHRRYNALPDSQKGRCMLREVLPRYIMALDMALMDGDMLHADRLVKTIGTTLRVLLVSLHDDFFLPDGESIPVPVFPTEVSGSGIGYLADLGPIIFALNRISGDRPRQDCSFLSIETLLIKLQLEMFSLVICPVKSVMFRCIMTIVHDTAVRANELMTEIVKKGNPAYYIKWINNSVIHRDYMRILKEFKIADENGCKADIPHIVIPSNIHDSRLFRPLTAPPVMSQIK